MCIVFNRSQSKNLRAFTLAEVLITLTVIGIVAALTIPAVVRNYQDRTWSKASQVFERKLEEALKSMNAQETLAGYSTTKDFVNELSKHIKITKICDNNELTSCFSEKVYWGVDKEEVDISKIKNAKNFGQDDWGTENIGIQFSNGINGIIAYNPACAQDPYNNQYTGINCIALLYDVDGYKAPNTTAKDLMSLNVLHLGKSNSCAIQLNDGTCFTVLFKPTPVNQTECKEMLAEGYDIGACPWTNTDYYWVGAIKQCGGAQNMPSATQLDLLAKELYPEATISTTLYEHTYATKDTTIAQAIGVPSSNFSLCSGEIRYADTSTVSIYCRTYKSNNTYRYTSAGFADSDYFVCLAD